MGVGQPSRHRQEQREQISVKVPKGGLESLGNQRRLKRYNLTLGALTVSPHPTSLMAPMMQRESPSRLFLKDSGHALEEGRQLSSFEASKMVSGPARTGPPVCQPRYHQQKTFQTLPSPGESWKIPKARAGTRVKEKPGGPLAVFLLHFRIWLCL